MKNIGSLQHNPFRTRFIPTPPSVTHLRIYTVSCLMPETTGMKVTDLPRLPKRNDSLRILVIAGNLTHLVGDLDTAIIEYLVEDPRSCWDLTIYVPGPWDYGQMDVDGGDEMLNRLSQVFPEKFICLFPRKTSCVQFANPPVKIIGAPLWPVDPHIYRTSRIYECTPEHPTPKAAIMFASFMTEVTANKRRDRDVAALLSHLRSPRETPDETRIVVTYGCPYEELALKAAAEITTYFCTVPIGGGKGMNDVIQGNGEDGKGLGVDHWLVGGHMDGPPFIRKVGNILFHNNRYDSSRGRFYVDAVQPGGVLEVGKGKKK